jgi:subtilisin-like proprotein convertase family protein
MEGCETYSVRFHDFNCHRENIMRKSKRPASRSKTNRLEFEQLERRNLLANDLLPDIFAWASEDRGYMHDYYIEGDLLRFSTAFANQGEGHLEVTGGDVLANGNQEVLQRIYDDEGGFRERVAGEFTYHPGHGHIHFDGYAIYNLREIGPAGEVGDIVATGGKISFCLIDITPYANDAGSSNYGSCGTTQGVSAGWSDVYGSGLSDQWINISGIDDGDYYLEVVTDPEDQLVESDETNNTTIITVSIVDGPGAQGDRWESNNTFATATNFGLLSDRIEPGLSIHTDTDVDFYQFNAVEDGDFSVTVNFSHDLGNVDAFIYDSDFNVVASGDSVTDIEELDFAALASETYFLEVLAADSAVTGYDLEFHGPGELTSETTMSTDGSIDIPDSGGGSITSTLQGPDITLADANLIFADLQHTYLGDLSFELTSPSGTTATIIRSTFQNPGGQLGSQNDFLNTIIDDQAPTAIQNGSAPYTGSFNVNYDSISNPMSVFNGENALGQWTVTITDWAGSDTGTLHSWGMMFTGFDNNPGDNLEQNDAFPQATDLGTIGTAGFVDLSIHRQSDVDFFRFNAQASSEAQIDLGFLHDDGNIDFIVYDNNQQEIARADSVTNNESLTVPVVGGELYFIQVFGVNNQTNEYSFDIQVPALDAVITERQVYYGGSSFIGADAIDGVAIDKQFLQPGETATFANYTSYTLGINGLILEVDDLNGTPTVDNIGDYFEFTIGNDDTPDSWAAAPAPIDVEFVTDFNGSGTDRVVLTWADNAIQNTWLETTVLAGPTTGLAAPDVFYFGNAIGETGNDSGNTRVNLTDVGLTRSNQSGFTAAEIDNNYDFDRSGRVNLVDVAIARTNQSGFTSLNLIAPTTSGNRSGFDSSKGFDSTKSSLLFDATVTEIFATKTDQVEQRTQLVDSKNVAGSSLSGSLDVNGAAIEFEQRSFDLPGRQPTDTTVDTVFKKFEFSILS